MVFTYLVILHFLGFESVLLKNLFKITLDIYLPKAKECNHFHKRKNYYLALLLQLSATYKGVVLTHPKCVN